MIMDRPYCTKEENLIIDGFYKQLDELRKKRKKESFLILLDTLEEVIESIRDSIEDPDSPENIRAKASSLSPGEQDILKGLK